MPDILQIILLILQLLSFFNSLFFEKKSVEIYPFLIWLVTLSAALFLLFPFFSIGALGAGDCKLLAILMLRIERPFLFLIHNYEFACMPLKNTAHYLREALCSLLTFLLSHLDNSDEDLVSVMYAINDVLPYGNISPIMLYDLFEEGLSKQEKEREEKESSAEEKANSSVEELLEESPEPSSEKKLSFRDRHYVPSFAEICALALFIAGLAMVSYNIYMRLI